MKALIFLSLMTTAFSASAYYDTHYHYRPERESCIKERYTLVSTEVKSASACKETLGLKLKEGLFNYPLINVGPLRVRYWQGRFEKTKKTIETYKHEYINVCSGQITFTETSKREYLDTDVFDLFNPNLNAQISESYKTSPMTTDEAKTAFEKLKIECEIKIENEI